LSFVAGQDKTAKQLSAAEIQFPDAALGGIFSVTSKLTSIPGTCMGIFTSHSDAGLDVPLGWHDEHDIEMLGASLLTTQTKPYYQPAGMQMTYYRPS
jgi:beta-glucanase (GH16 family)